MLVAYNSQIVLGMFLTPACGLGILAGGDGAMGDTMMTEHDRCIVLVDALHAIRDDETQRLDVELDHVDADELLLEHIGDKRVTEAFGAIVKWYA